MDTDMLLQMRAFLQETADTNEDTEYDPAQEYLVEAIIELARSKNESEIVEEFETPFVHPMITIQKRVAELKDLVEAEIAKQNPQV